MAFEQGTASWHRYSSISQYQDVQGKHAQESLCDEVYRDTQGKHVETGINTLPDGKNDRIQP